MEKNDNRQVTTLIADDLAWLESHCRQQPTLARETAQIRLAAALVRNAIGPFLESQSTTPIHIAVVGGAGTGKSTIVNFLVGRVVAEANPQAGYTRHPTAYILGSSPTAWVGHLGFLGPLRRLDESVPGNLDEDVYQVRRVNTGTNNPLGDAVIWDCPDMTTWAATGYVPRLIEVAGLADVIVYVASDERYNDEVPTQFLHMLIRAGKAVVVVLTKMDASQAGPIVEHFEREILSRLPKGPSGRPPIPVMAISHLMPDQLADPATKAAAFRIPLLNQVAVLGEPSIARKRHVGNAVQYLGTAAADLLGVAKQDLAAIEAWRTLVLASRQDFDARYRNEFLNGEGFRRFDDARERLLSLLELPGAGKGFALALWALRLPYRGLRHLIGKAIVRPAAANTGETQVLSTACEAWLDRLRAEAIRLTGTHPLWKHVATGFSSNFGEQAKQEFLGDLRNFQVSSADEIEGAARSITAGLEANPAGLAILRGFKLLLDVVAIVLAFWAGWFNWYILLYLPLFVSASHQLVELVVRQFVEAKRSKIRTKKMSIVSQTISTPLAHWLSDWPATGGSTYEKLQATLRRVPESIAHLRGLIEPLIRP